jgi:hypothetical protein
MFLAEWSGGPAIKNQQDIELIFKIGQADDFSFKISQGKIRGWDV